jgi:hypothetical protein
MSTESFATQSLPNVVPVYVYSQYADDPDIQSFFAALNSEAQGYVDWFNNTPLSVYTADAISGPLLDWVGQGIYGIARPSMSTLSTRSYGNYNAITYNTLAFNTRKHINSGDAEMATDDLYKRTLTWYAYLGDGRQMSIQWLRRRVARFIYGVNGTDVTADYFSKISITQPALAFSAAFGTPPYNTQAYATRKSRKIPAARALQIILPAGQISEQFKILLDAGYLALPFQVRFTVVITP